MQRARLLVAHARRACKLNHGSQKLACCHVHAGCPPSLQDAGDLRPHACSEPTCKAPADVDGVSTVSQCTEGLLRSGPAGLDTGVFFQSTSFAAFSTPHLRASGAGAPAVQQPGRAMRNSFPSRPASLSVPRWRQPARKNQLQARCFSSGLQGLTVPLLAVPTAAQAGAGRSSLLRCRIAARASACPLTRDAAASSKWTLLLGYSSLGQTAAAATNAAQVGTQLMITAAQLAADQQHWLGRLWLQSKRQASLPWG